MDQCSRNSSIRNCLKLNPGYTYTAILFVVAALQCGRASAATLYAGSCEPGGYSTIQLAVDHAVAGDTVLVCPGNYFETISIDKDLVLSGVTNPKKKVARPTIFYPSAVAKQCGIVPGDPEECPQIYVTKANVEISGLNINGSNFVFQCNVDPVGIEYQDATGFVLTNSIVNHVVQCGSHYAGFGVGTKFSNPGNFDFHAKSNVISNFGLVGIIVLAALPEDLTVGGDITGNEVTTNVPGSGGIEVESVDGVSIDSNTVIGTLLADGGVSVVSSRNVKVTNNILSIGMGGIFVTDTTKSTFSSNLITTVSLLGIGLSCSSSNNLTSNTIVDVFLNQGAPGVSMFDCKPESNQGSDENMITDNTIAGMCSGILTGSALNTGNTIAPNTYIGIGPGADVMAGNTCP